jgi:hypothetical protein
MIRAATFLLLTVPAVSAAADGFADASAFLKRHCTACHAGATPAGGFGLSAVLSADSLQRSPRLWSRVQQRVQDGEMPPLNAPAPKPEARERFLSWLDTTLRTAACADGITPVRMPARRLSRGEYAATIRDLLNVHINAAQSLPADGAGGEGFDNAAETLFLSPLHAEKYLEAAKSALAYAATDSRSRARFLPHEPSSALLPRAAARRNLEHFLPKAFRRPARPGEVERYLQLFDSASKRGDTFDRAMLYALQGVLISPHFLFHVEEENPGSAPRPLPPFALASRLSYFLWGSMPDDALFELAAQGKLQEDAVLREQITRMLKDVRSRDFAEQFVEQWLGTRELGRDIKPDAKLFPAYQDADLQGAIRYEPILFFQEILVQNHSLLYLLDSPFTFLTNKLARHYGLQLKGADQQPRRFDLPAGSRRGGVLGMSAVLAVSSMPTRTSPVLRGKWILESILGTPPPPPPPNVPELKEEHGGASPRTMRERLSKHRENAACAGCHSRIDPLGFALENYDVLGQWRDQEGGQPVDARGELPDGRAFDGAAELKQVLLERRQLFLRNLSAKMLGYALARGLTLEDHCTVEQLVASLENGGHQARLLIDGIVLSTPFRQQAGSPAPPSQSGKKREPVYHRK